MIIQNLTTYFLQPIPQCPQTAPLRDDLHRERPRRGRVRTEEFDTRSPRVGATSDTFWAGFEMLLLPKGLSATGSPAQAFQLQFRIGKTAAQIMQGHTAQLCAQQWCCERCFFGETDVVGAETPTNLVYQGVMVLNCSTVWYVWWKEWEQCFWYLWSKVKFFRRQMSGILTRNSGLEGGDATSTPCWIVVIKFKKLISFRSTWE